MHSEENVAAIYTTLIGSHENQNLAINSWHLEYNYPPPKFEYKEFLTLNSHCFEITFEARRLANNSSYFDLLDKIHTSFNHSNKPSYESEFVLQTIDPTLDIINLRIEASSFRSLVFDRDDTCLESDLLDHKFIYDSNCKFKENIEI